MFLSARCKLAITWRVCSPCVCSKNAPAAFTSKKKKCRQGNCFWKQEFSANSQVFSGSLLLIKNPVSPLQLYCSFLFFFFLVSSRTETVISPWRAHTPVVLPHRCFHFLCLIVAFLRTVWKCVHCSWLWFYSLKPLQESCSLFHQSSQQHLSVLTQNTETWLTESLKLIDYLLY